MASSSEDDIAASPPVENIMPPQPIMLLPKPPSSRVYKTALDVINETIVKTLDSPHPGKKRELFCGGRLCTYFLLFHSFYNILKCCTIFFILCFPHFRIQSLSSLESCETTTISPTTTQTINLSRPFTKTFHRIYSIFQWRPSWRIKTQ